MHLVFTRMPSESTSSGGVYAPCIKLFIACQVRVHPVMEFMHLVFTRMPGESTSSGGIFAHCIYSHASESTSSGGVDAPCIKILLACQVRVHPLVEFMQLVLNFYSHGR